MGRVVTVMNMKGGVGKTTITVNVGAVCAYYRIGGVPRSILLFDYDPQFNLTQAFLAPDKYFQMERERRTALGVLQEDEANLDPFTLQVPGNERPPNIDDIVHTVKRFRDTVLDLVPSTLDLLYLALGADDKTTGPMERRFERFIEACRTKYDLVFVDCHPAGSFFTKTALRNSDDVLIPVVDNVYAERGVGMMMRFIEAKTIGRGKPTPHILFNHTPRSGGASDTEARIRDNPQLGSYCLENSLHKYKAFAEPFSGRGFVWTSNKPWSVEARYNLFRVARELCGRIEGAS